MPLQKETVTNNGEYSVRDRDKRVKKRPKKFDKFELDEDILQLAESAVFPSLAYSTLSVSADDDEF